MSLSLSLSLISAVVKCSLSGEYVGIDANMHVISKLLPRDERPERTGKT